MARKNIMTRLSLGAVLALALQAPVYAQDIHFTQFEAAPLTVNPSFTGGFNGQYRAAAVYRNQWKSVTIPFVTYAASFDMPLVYDISHDDYLAGGIQLYNDRAGDGNLTNFSGLASVAYHKFMGENAQIGVGVQGGYTEKSIDISKLYFGDEFLNGTFQPGTSAEYPYLNNRVKYFTVNAGISFSQNVGQKFGYVLGVGANNLNQPKDALEKKTNSDVGLAMRYTGQLGIIAFLGDRFSIRPAALYQMQASASELIAGNEFNYIVGNPDVHSFATAIFLSGWYRTGDAAMATVGVEFKGFKFGVSYDYNLSSLKDASNGKGGFEISLRYIAPNPLDFAHRLVYPCSRF